MSTTTTVVSRWPLVKCWVSRCALAVGSLVGIYAAFLLLGFIPINGGYRVPPASDRVRIFIRSNEIHTDIVLPTVHEELGIDWRKRFPPRHFSASVAESPYVAVGWGNRRFFVETPTWADLKVSSVLGALFWPSESVLHVEYLPAAAPEHLPHAVDITKRQYQELVRFVESSLAGSNEVGCARIASDVTYGPADRFYVSAGRYHCFNTCNQWTGRGLARAGVPVGIWTPLKPQVLCWLPESMEGEKEGRNE
jgi:uncharacterized protein (TIGR02117 family)